MSKSAFVVKNGDVPFKDYSLYQACVTLIEKSNIKASVLKGFFNGSRILKDGTYTVYKNKNNEIERIEFRENGIIDAVFIINNNIIILHKRFPGKDYPGFEDNLSLKIGDYQSILNKFSQYLPKTINTIIVDYFNNELREITINQHQQTNFWIHKNKDGFTLSLHNGNKTLYIEEGEIIEDIKDVEEHTSKDCNNELSVINLDEISSYKNKDILFIPDSVNPNIVFCFLESDFLDDKGNILPTKMLIQNESTRVIWTPKQQNRIFTFLVRKHPELEYTLKQRLNIVNISDFDLS